MLIMIHALCVFFSFVSYLFDLKMHFWFNFFAKLFVFLIFSVLICGVNKSKNEVIQYDIRQLVVALTELKFVSGTPYIYKDIEKGLSETHDKPFLLERIQVNK